MTTYSSRWGRGGDKIQGWIEKYLVISDSTSGENAEIVDNSMKPEGDQTISSGLEVEILETPTGRLRESSNSTSWIRSDKSLIQEQ